MDGDTGVNELCDALCVLMVDGVPGDQLGKWRDSVDRATWSIRPPDPSTWGLRPDQVAAQERLMRAAGDKG